jgi:hypothetical protein
MCGEVVEFYNHEGPVAFQQMRGVSKAASNNGMHPTRVSVSFMQGLLVNQGYAGG